MSPSMKAIFAKINFKDESGKKNVMGTSSAGFQDNQLDVLAKTVVKLTYYLFNNLDRQMIAALEKSMNMSGPHKRNIRRLIAELADQHIVLVDILKPTRRMSHNDRYMIFGKLCDIAERSERYDVGLLRRLISIGKKMDISDEEIERWVEKKGLAA